jgi:hypothetical protein
LLQVPFHQRILLRLRTVFDWQPKVRMRFLILYRSQSLHTF